MAPSTIISHSSHDNITIKQQQSKVKDKGMSRDMYGDGDGDVDGDVRDMMRA